jgi:hypothetical protein
MPTLENRLESMRVNNLLDIAFKRSADGSQRTWWGCYGE